MLLDEKVLQIEMKGADVILVEEQDQWLEKDDDQKKSRAGEGGRDR